MMPLILLLILIVLLGVGGGRFYPDHGYYSWGPFGLIVVLFLVLFLLGVIHL